MRFLGEQNIIIFFKIIDEDILKIGKIASLHFVNVFLFVLQIIFGVNRVKNLDWQIKYGSQWVSITNELVKTILEHEEKITSIFQYTKCKNHREDSIFISFNSQVSNN